MYMENGQSHFWHGSMVVKDIYNNFSVEILLVMARILDSGRISGWMT